MHEASLAVRMVRIACDAAADQPGTVTAVTVVVGELSGIVPGALHSAFALLKRGTRVEQARLIIEPEPARARCSACGVEYAVGGFPCACPACGSQAFAIVAGEDFSVKALELRREERE